MKLEPDLKPRTIGEKESLLRSRLEAIEARGDIDIRAKANARAAIKHETLIDVLVGALPFQDGNVRLVAASPWPRGGVALTVEIMDGSWRPFDGNPWVIMNPPVLVADDAGDVARAIEGKEERYRVDVLGALRAAMRRRFGA